MYNHLNNEWGIFLKPKSLVKHLPANDKSIPQHYFNFTSIIQINSTIISSIVDIVGVVTNTSASSPIYRKDGS